ncbi:MAG TPA: NADH-quinone oxidoreductase subunit NuoH [Nitrospiraceae bacterium]|nr:NADH-quinone oxidoreductase subunit NuoH [Nitrospiraceae bacterium]
MAQILNIVYTILIPVAVLFGFIMLNAAYLSYMERKTLAWMQSRMGPMMAGYHGILQPIADGVKLFFKEDIIPAKADKWVFIVAPLILLVMSLASFVVIPFGPPTRLFGILSPENAVPLWVTNLNIGVLYVLALASIGTYGVIMAGWASNNKYSLLGSFRSAAQMISYEIPMAFAIITVVLMAGSLNLTEIVNAQTGKWFIFTYVGPVVFFLYLVSGIAETNRAPFDLPEAESELVAGFFTEYTGMRFAMFFMAEYANMVVVALLISIMFFGGWLPLQIFPSVSWLGGMAPISWVNTAMRAVPPVLWLLAKVYFFIFCFIWIRATLPRLRYDQLMKFSWKILLPLSLVTLLATAFLKQAGLL